MTSPDLDTLRPTTAPVPKRFWWLRLGLAVGLVVALAVGVTRVWWGRYAARQFDAEVVKMRALGEPVFAEDFNAAPVPNDQNAAILLRRATDRILEEFSGPASSNLDYPESPPYTKEWHALADASEKANGETFALARQARSLPQVDWEVRFTSPLINTPLGPLSRQRQLAITVADGMLRSHLHGDDHEAIERTLDLLRHTEAVRSPPMFLTDLVSFGCEAHALYRLQVIAGSLAIESGVASPRFATTQPSDAPATLRPATRAQVKQLISQLQAKPDGVADVRAAIVYERAFMADTIQYFAGQARLTYPLVQLGMAKAFRESNRTLDVFGVSTLSDLRAGLQRIAPATKGKDVRTLDLWASYQSGFAFTYDRYLDSRARVVAERRMAVVILAARLYYADHGRWPQAASDLVPTYLDSMPIDPYANPPVPVRYDVLPNALPDGTDRPVVSVRVPAVQAPAPPTKPTYVYATGTLGQARDVSSWSPPAQVEKMRSAATKPAETPVE